MATKKTQDTMVVIDPPNLKLAIFTIQGQSQYVQNRFSNKAKIATEYEMTEADRKKARKEMRAKPKDLHQAFLDSMHEMANGDKGIPAAAFRSGMIDACRLVPGITMTNFKLSAWVLGDGVCIHDECDLVKLEGEPEPRTLAVKLPGPGHTMDIRTRAHWPTWKARVRVQYDADQLSLQSLTNLMMRVGLQVGVGEGRNYSKSSGGMGWGRFEVAEVMSAG